MGEGNRRQDAGSQDGRSAAQGRAARPVGSPWTANRASDLAWLRATRPDMRPPPLNVDEVALFQDLDGSLLELAPTPGQVEVAAYLPGLLHRLNQALGGALAIVTGRPLSAIDRLLHPLLLAGAGLHGAELRRDPLGEVIVGGRIATAGAAEALRQYFAGDERVLIEDKGAAVALHFRLAPERAAECSAVVAALASAMGLAAQQGKMVIEALPPSVNKGQALQWLMALPPFAGRMPVFIGDDLTDENGILVAQAMGGYGIKVGGGPSAAHYHLDSVTEVHRWLAAGVALQDFVP